MRRKKNSMRWTVTRWIMTLAILCIAGLMTDMPAMAQQEKILADFANNGKTVNPFGGLIFDAEGNLYGTSEGGGTFGYGTVFELLPNGSGSWKTKVLYNFGNGEDGQSPRGGLIFDASGNLYGTTRFGGSGTGPCYYDEPGCGTVFELTPNGSGGWQEKVLYNFKGNGDGYLPAATLVMDATGNLYGTTVYGGAFPSPLTGGTVFELKHEGEHWTEGILHSFGNGTDGDFPQGNLIFDAAGNLYGTTALGGSYPFGNGIVFELQPKGESWSEKILVNFTADSTGVSGVSPMSGLIFDAAGNLYGTTAFGGTHDWGTVFELTPASGGTWTETVLRSFNYNSALGTEPQSGVVFDAAGNLYGTTSSGGTGQMGTVYELLPKGDGTWTIKILHNFQENGKDGNNPYYGLILDAEGNLYGMTPFGGTGGQGTVFEIVP